MDRQAFQTYWSLPRDLTLSESLASKLLDIECTLEED